MRYSLNLVVSSFVFMTTSYTNDSQVNEIAETCIKIIYEQPTSVKAWIDDKVYLNPDKVFLTKRGAFVQNKKSLIQLPAFSYDQNGPFLICSREEAQEHFDRAKEAAIDAVWHSAAAGASIEVPPLAVFEGYRAVEAWKEAAREYNAGWDAINRNGGD